MEENINININMVPIESIDKSEIGEICNFSKIMNEKLLSDFNLMSFTVKPNCITGLDQHKVKEYWYFAKGDGLLFVDGVEVQAKEGRVYFFDSLVTHQVKNTSQTNLEIFSIWW